MIRVEPTIKGDNHFPISSLWTGSGQISSEARTRHPGLVRPMVAHELNLSGSQLVVRCICFLGVAKLLLWALIKLWLFEP